MKRTHTTDLIKAIRILARDIQSEDGVANAAIAEAADRLEKQQRKIRNQRREIEALAKDKKRVDGFVNWLDAEIRKVECNPSKALLPGITEREMALREAKRQLQKLRSGLGEQQQPHRRRACVANNTVQYQTRNGTENASTGRLAL